MAIEIKSFNQILGAMVRKIIAETPLSDINPGSVFLSLLEACASQDFDNNVAILNILDLLNVDSIRNNDLDNKAADLGLTRKLPVAASGAVRLSNINITKQSTALYSLKPAPISGQTKLFVNSTIGWSLSGSLYIGRGTNSFEGPIPYSSITVFGTYSQINLGAALQKDHLASDTVINAQGQPDRVIPAGAVVKIPANNQNPEIQYSSIRDAIIPAGEDHVDGTLVVAKVPGTLGNALIGTIRQFDTAPFIGAAIANTVAFSTGADIETDVQLRNRIKAYASSLARGTSPAILSAVLGLSDPDENKRVASAILSQPVSTGSPSILYIDDGSGFQPSQAGQTVDVLLARANGTEEFLQLANYPLPRAQVINDASGPFAFIDNMFLRVAVDGVEETVVFTPSDFSNISVALLSEIVAAINAKATLFKARLTDDSLRILLFTVDPDAEIIQVVPIRDSDIEARYANNLLNFPVKEVSYIALFQNSTRLHQRERIATVETIPFALWNLFAPGDLLVSVDGTPVQDQNFTLSDFPNISSFTVLTLDSWVDAINAKFAGVTAIATPNQTMQISSNKRGAGASIEVLGGTYQEQMFGSNATFATGQDSQFQINRSNGNIRVLTDITEGDIITAGIADAKGFVVSAPTETGTYNFDVDDEGRQSQMVICADATYCDKIGISLAIDSTLIITDQGSSVMRIKAQNGQVFRNVQPGHFIYIAYRSTGTSWVDPANSGLFKVISRGSQISFAFNDTYIEVWNNVTVPQTVTVADIGDIQAFKTDAYPQLWTSSYLNVPTAASLDDLSDSLNTALLGVKATVFRTNSVKITSTTEEGGSIAMPVSIGLVSAVFSATDSVQMNNIPLIANKTPNKDMIGFFKTQPIVSQNAYLGRAQYPPLFASLTANANPDTFPYTNAYSELVTSTLLTNANVDLSDLLLFSRGDNEGLLRSIKAKPTNTTVGTQQGVPRTLFDHTTNDRIQVFNSLQMAQDDNVVIVMDQDAIIKTISIPASRTGQMNSGSDSLTFIPTSTEFSANDMDNEPGVDFSTINVWGTDINNTDFSDYSVLMRARNWYASGGTGSVLGKFIIRFAEYGVNGNKYRFDIEYPALPNTDNTTVLINSPSFNKLSYKFGAGTARSTGIPPGTTINVTGPYANPTVNFPGGASGIGSYWDYTFTGGDISSVLIGDVISAISGCGFAINFLGQSGVKNKSGTTLRTYSQTAFATTITVTNPDLFNIFPITKTTVTDIVAKINESNIMTAAAVGLGSASVTVSTFEDQYTYVTNATALGNGHNPNVPSLQGFINLVDGVADVQSFSNDNPNFTLKGTLVLPASGVSATIYRMDTAPNEDMTLGEYFKLVPTTIKNIKHHFTQKALSQLPIVAEVSIADSGKRVQIVSKELGGNGAIEILGGQANTAQTSVLGQSVISSDTSGSYLLATVSAFPNTYAQGDVVKITNQRGVPRLTQFASTSTLSVAALVSDRAEYYYNGLATNFVALTTITIADVSSSYLDYTGTPYAAGLIWRWTHSIGHGESVSLVRPGHQVIALSCPGWDNTNMAKLPGDGSTVGLPVIAVNDAAHTFDVVNPFGKAMSATVISTGTVSICPVPRNRWNLAHVAPTTISSIARAANVITIQTIVSHNLNTGDSAIIRDSIAAIPDNVYGPITVVGPQTYTFVNAGSNIVELNIGATSLPFSGANPTSYRLHKIGANNLVRISATAGNSPRFADCGVAVDDYLVIQGTTFNSSNNGIHRVLAVDNNSIVFEHEGAVDDRNHLLPFNYNSLSVQWTANSNIVTGVAGAFKQLATGVWVKKVEDDDSLYLQITGNDTGNYLTATKIFLGQLYSGVTGSALGVRYDMIGGYDTGVYLANADDILIYEGDSAFKTDTLNVQTITGSSWFNPNNTGQFEIIEIGNNPSDCRPFVRVNNSIAVTEANRALSAAPQGFYIIENDLYKYSTYRTITNSTISDTDNLKRSIYMLPDARAYKIAEPNESIMAHVGKLGFDLITSVGTDGYLYYTGLLRKTQRVVDGFAPDPATYAERRAVGSRIEILPPLIRDIAVVITVTTGEGATIQDISGNIKSAIIDYVNALGVGQDVILSAIIAAVMKVKGVAAATFNTPVPSEERITVASNEKALINADAIGIV